jgi:hypothetical protein
VFDGNTADPKTLLPQVENARRSFGIERLVMVGDRGMISNVQIDGLRKLDGVDWITTLKSGAIAKLAEARALQLDLFDERNLISLTHADCPGERLIACRNPALAKLRAEKRKDLITATARELEKVAAMVTAGRLEGADKIGVRVGKVIGKYKVGKHFDLDIRDASFKYSLNEARVAAEAALDGLYVIRTSVAGTDMTAEAAVLNYEAGRGRARLPHAEGHRSPGAPDPPPPRDPCEGTHLLVHARLLRAVAHDPGVAAPDLRGRGR